MRHVKAKLHHAPDVQPPATLGITEDGSKEETPVQRQVEQPAPANRLEQARALVGSQGAAGAGSRARLMRSAQAVLGNTRTGQIAMAAPAGMGPVPSVQRQPAAANPALAAVQSVRSLYVEENLAGAVGGAEAMLERRLQQRRAAIEKDRAAALALSEQPWAREKAETLNADLAKDLDAILASPDSKYVSPDLRKSIVAASRAVSTKKSALVAGKAAWGRFDPVFADPEVAKTLGAKGFTAAELKALIAQESGDLTIDDTERDIAGIGQIGSDEAREVGAKPADRLVPKKAIPLAAKVLVHKANQLEAQLSEVPEGDDYKKFVFAAYNAGPGTIAKAQEKAIALGRDGKSWAALVEGGANSPLYYGIQKALPELNPARKYEETTRHVARICKRLE